MPLSPARGPDAHESDVQIEGNTSGELMGPGIFGGNVRYRRGVSERVALTADAGMIRVRNEGSTLNPNAGTARAGVHVHDRKTGDFAVAAFAGAGGGYAPEAGGWITGDIGGAVAGDHPYFRPTLVLGAYLSQPVATEVFTVDDTMLRLPRTLGVQGLLGFDVGPRDRAVMIGLAVARLYAMKNDKQDALAETFVGLGGGFRFGAI